MNQGTIENGYFMKSIYVGNLSPNASESDLQQAFATYGAVSAVRIFRNRKTGRPRGFAFVEMADPSAAANAIRELNLRKICGHSISVNEACPKTGRPRRDGGFHQC